MIYLSTVRNNGPFHLGNDLLVVKSALVLLPEDNVGRLLVQPDPESVELLLDHFLVRHALGGGSTRVFKKVGQQRKIVFGQGDQTSTAILLVGTLFESSTRRAKHAKKKKTVTKKKVCES